MSTGSRYIGGVLTFFDNATQERVLPLAPLVFQQDFLGAGYEVIPAAAAAGAGADFVKKIVGTGPPTVVGTKAASGGVVACALTVTSEKQDAALYWDDYLAFDAAKGFVFEARVALSVLPSVAAVQTVWGMASNWIDGPDNNTCYLQFGATGNGAVLIRSFDGVTTKSIASGVTLTAGVFHTFRIDANNPLDVGFYIDGVQVNVTGAVPFAAVSPLSVLQPYIAAYKASGTGVGTVAVDYVRAWQGSR